MLTEIIRNKYVLYRKKFHTSIEINDSTNLYTQNSKKERRFRKWKYSTARTQIHGSTTGNLYTVHRTLIFIKNVTIESLLWRAATGFKCIEWEGIRDKERLHAVRLPLEALLHIWHINSILNVKVSAPWQRSYGLQDLLCHGTTRSYIKLNACAERRNVHGGAFLAVAQRMWNSLPVNIGNEENFDTFKFFKLAFY